MSDWQGPRSPIASPCPKSPSGRHRWQEPWVRDRRPLRRDEDLSARACRLCGAAGSVDAQGVTRVVDARIAP